jgi:hypothetical protein
LLQNWNRTKTDSNWLLQIWNRTKIGSNWLLQNWIRTKTGSDWLLQKLERNQNWFQLVVAKPEPTWIDEKIPANQTDLLGFLSKEKDQQTMGP